MFAEKRETMYLINVFIFGIRFLPANTICVIIPNNVDDISFLPVLTGGGNAHPVGVCFCSI